MKNRNNKKGFTLLEIIVVIIILGVLAGLALPRLFSNIEFSRSAEALNSISAIRGSVERCAMIAGDVYAGCTSFAPGGTLDLDDPALEAGAHFTYVVAPGAAAGDYAITATRNATLDGGDGISTVVLTVSRTGGTTDTSGSGVFASL